MNRRSVQNQTRLWENGPGDQQNGQQAHQPCVQIGPPTGLVGQLLDQLALGGRRMEVDGVQVVNYIGDEDQEIRQDQVIFSGGEQMILGDRLHPGVPAPVHSEEEDSDGLCAIDRVGGWNAFLCEFQVLEEVPTQHKGTWVWA